MIKIVALLALFGEGRTQETSEDREFTMPETPVSKEIPADAEFYEQDAQETEIATIEGQADYAGASNYMYYDSVNYEYYNDAEAYYNYAEDAYAYYGGDAYAYYAGDYTYYGGDYAY